MAIDFLTRPLRAIPLFQGLSASQITEIARRAERRVYRPGEPIIGPHMPADAAVLIVSGDAARTEAPDFVSPDDPEPVPAGALLGEMGMLVETEYTSSVTAVTAVRALRITRNELLAQMAEDPTLAEHFVKKIAARLHALAEEMRAVDALLVPQDEAIGNAKPEVPSDRAAAAQTIH
ncbi:MAG: Crp/Fnr family transcriptional regulator [Hyphomicrobiaceae bacterium]